MTVLGAHPEGTENDPRAPWNERDESHTTTCDHCDAAITYVMVDGKREGLHGRRVRCSECQGMTCRSCFAPDNDICRSCADRMFPLTRCEFDDLLLRVIALEKNTGIVPAPAEYPFVGSFAADQLLKRWTAMHDASKPVAARRVYGEFTLSSHCILDETMLHVEDGKPPMMWRDIKAAINRPKLAVPESDEIGKLRDAKDNAYSERDQLVCALSKLFPSRLERHREEDKNWDDDWRWIVFIDLPAGQASWHIHDSELGMFNHLRRDVQARTWDGHSTCEKYQRLASLDSDTHVLVERGELERLRNEAGVNASVHDHCQEALKRDLGVERGLHAVTNQALYTALKERDDARLNYAKAEAENATLRCNCHNTQDDEQRNANCPVHKGWIMRFKRMEKLLAEVMKEMQ